MTDIVEIYNTIRAEIVNNHTLMHWYSIIVAVVILAGILVVETRRTLLSVFLPLLAVAWAASIVRFDFFIHRQAAYLRYLELQMTSETSLQFWETWKASHGRAVFVIPLADIFAVTVIVIPTIYLLFGPAKQYFKSAQWRGGNLYAWGITAVLFALLLSLLAIPKIAG